MTGLRLETVQYTVTAVLDTGSICDHQASNRTVTLILNAITERTSTYTGDGRVKQQ
jgi:hypothetical protein